MRKVRFLILMTMVAASGLGCTDRNPYDESPTDTNQTATYGGLGALAGAAAGALISHDHRGQGALIGSMIGGLAGGGYGAYADQQEDELRVQMADTGVEIKRQGDVIQLVMPGNITFATDSDSIAPSFFGPLSTMATSFKGHTNNSIEIVGYTDNRGSAAYNQRLSELRAQSVANYLAAQGVQMTRVTTKGQGLNLPIANNNTVDGRAQNRRVELTLRPLVSQRVLDQDVSHLPSTMKTASKP